MAQWLRVPTALLEDLGSIPSTCTAAHNCLKLQGLHPHRHTYRQNTDAHKIKVNNLKKRSLGVGFQEWDYPKTIPSSSTHSS